MSSLIPFAVLSLPPPVLCPAIAKGTTFNYEVYINPVILQLWKIEILMNNSVLL
jgi:hypothetical protein